MMRRPPGLLRVVTLLRPLLPPVTLKHRRVQVQTVALAAERHPLQLPRPQRLIHPDYHPLREALEQIPDRAVGWKTLDPHQRPVGPQHRTVRKTPRPRHPRDHKRREGFLRRNGLRRFQMHRQITTHLLREADPSEKIDEYTQPPEGRHRPRCLAQYHFLSAPK